MKLIEIDGNYGSGGGQIIRTAIAMSALTGIPCRIYNIRAKREIPGLSYQHLTAVKAVQELCNASVKGAELRSREIYFYPNKIKSGRYFFNVGTAGSITLVLQALLPPSIMAKDDLEFRIIGGTNVSHAPTSEYFQHVFCDCLKKFGIEIYSETLKYGFYPKGGGEMSIKVKPCKKLIPIDLTERGNLKKIDIWSISSMQLKNAEVAERQIKGFESELKVEKKNVIYADSLSIGTSVHSHAHYENCKIGADVLGEKGLAAEKVGKNCAELLKKEMSGKGCLDTHMADQILPFMALAGGRISVNEITEHAKTNIFVIEKFLPIKLEISENIISIFRR